MCGLSREFYRQSRERRRAAVVLVSPLPRTCSRPSSGSLVALSKRDNITPDMAAARSAAAGQVNESVDERPVELHHTAITTEFQVQLVAQLTRLAVTMRAFGDRLAMFPKKTSRIGIGRAQV